MRLAAEVRKEPEEERKHNTDEKASDDGKVKGGVFAAVDDVAGEATEAEGELGTEVENHSDRDQERAEEKERAAEFARGIHSRVEFYPNRPTSPSGATSTDCLLPLNE